MKLAIVGSRSFTDYDFFKHEIETFIFENKLEISTIISGGARGTDSMAEIYAKERKIPIEIFLPDWDLHGKKAGYLRNIKIVDASDYVVAFWNGISAGTKHSIDIAKQKEKKLKIIYI